MISFTIADHADQKFAAVLGGRRVSLRVRYNVFTDRWSLDLSADGEAILHGRRIVLGTDLLDGLGLDLGALVARATNGEDLGRRALPDGTVRLYHMTQAQLREANAPV